MESLKNFFNKQETFMYGCDEKNRMLHLNSMPVDLLKEIKLSTANAAVKAESDLNQAKWSKDQLLNANIGRGNKWMSDHLPECWLEINFKGDTHTVAGIGFVTADDCPYRDPKKITIQYKDEEGSWVDSKTLEPEGKPEPRKVRELFPPGRNKLKKFNIPACKTTAFKFLLSHDGNHENFAFAQIQFYGDPDACDT